MSDPMACKPCATWYRENRPRLLKERELDEAGHNFMAGVYSDVASVLAAGGPNLLSGRVKRAANQKFPSGEWMNQRIRRFHDAGHSDTQPETVDPTAV